MLAEKLSWVTLMKNNFNHGGWKIFLINIVMTLDKKIIIHNTSDIDKKKTL